MSIITPNNTGISVNRVTQVIATVDSISPISNYTPAGIDALRFNTASIVEAPKGPDGKPLILTEDRGAWIPAATQPAFSVDDINNITNGGTNTNAVFERGLESIINEKEGDLLIDTDTPPVIINAGNVIEDFDAPGEFTADSKLIGQQLWKYTVYLYNHQLDKFQLPARTIKIMCIEDDLLSWPLRGYIVVDSRMEGFERSEDINLAYFLRSDSRDELYIEMWPEVERGNLPDEVWKIKNTFVVYDVEDLSHTDMTIKAKKLYFWDKTFQYLLEKNIQWSTATGDRYISDPCPEPIAHATDMERSMFTGEAIWSILKEAGYEHLIDLDRWEWGKTRINFTAKTDWSIWDNIQYILQQQISDDDRNDICIWQWDRGILKWTLQPYWKIFDLAGVDKPEELQKEHMFFEETTGGEMTISPMKAPLDLSVSYTIDIKADEFNKIRNYRFSQPAGIDNAKAFLTKPLYSHWHKKKQFDVDVKENEIKYVREEFFKKNYIEDRVLSPGNWSVMHLNTTKTDQKSIAPQFSPVSTLEPVNDRFIRSLEGRGKILFAGIFLNQSLVVRMTGSTHRLAGTFIGVDRGLQNSDTIYDYQVCGQYLVTNVKHIIQHQKYINDITMVKVHAYEALPVNEGIE